ncbi:MAG TPA: glycerophosphodiester phosphodiesterase family protein [Pyrinomonadaceae bacterium]|nr:glycerophosphodiester phosphodiesterase family protein [Pyrinomonadaceae bacterium]
MTATPLILGHRGASAVAPENTLAAFSRAILDGAEGIEFDVRLSRDGIPIVIHDASLKRTGLTDTMVSDLTAEQLQSVDVGSWFRRTPVAGRLPTTEPPYEGERIPTLEQVFELFRSNSAWLYVEMKSDAGEGAELAAAVVETLGKFPIASRVVVESFDLAAIAEIKRIDLSVRTAALFEPKLSRPISTIRRLKMVDLALSVQADEMALHYTLTNAGVVEKARDSGLETVVWTVDNPKWISRARRFGVKALISNDPASMVQYRDAAEHS